MPDITMCINEFCELKNYCYRYTANPKEFMQSYAEFKPKRNSEGLLDCDHYWVETRTYKQVNNKEGI